MSAVVRFILGSLAAIAVVVVGGFLALRHVTIREAERDTRERVELQGALVEASGLGDGVLRSDPRALERLDDVVAARILSPTVVRVKLWSRDGTVLYYSSRSSSPSPRTSTSARRASCWRRTPSSARRTARRCCSRPTSASTR